jgi:hypothetical protein
MTDVNPIQHVFEKVKHLTRQAAERTVDHPEARRSAPDSCSNATPPTNAPNPGAGKSLEKRAEPVADGSKRSRAATSCSL